MSAPGGYSLENHKNDTATTNKIKLGIWNYVILQEQSQIPAIDYFRYNSMYPSARFLDSMIRSKDASTVFFETWGRKYGGQQCIDTFCSANFRDYYQMQDTLKYAYLQISNILSAKMSSVGEAWRLAHSLDTNTDLWQSDYSHPTLNGSYLAACVFYIAIFDRSPVGLSYNGGLTDSMALYLQTIAYQSVIGIKKNSSKIPDKFYLYQNYPNPFNPSTKIKFDIPLSRGVPEGRGVLTTLKIYDILGREVATLVNERLQPGNYEYEFNGNSIASGVYYYKLVSRDYSETKKMVLIR